MAKTLRSLEADIHSIEKEIVSLKKRLRRAKPRSETHECIRASLASKMDRARTLQEERYRANEV